MPADTDIHNGTQTDMTVNIVLTPGLSNFVTFTFYRHEVTFLS